MRGLCPIFKGTKILALTRGCWPFPLFFLYGEAMIGVEKESVPTSCLPTRPAFARSEERRVGKERVCGRGGGEHSAQYKLKNSLAGLKRLGAVF